MGIKIIDIAGLNRFLTNVKEYIENLLISKQDTLISGTTIKSVNGESILGSGNLSIGNKTLITTTDTNISLLPNVYYRKTNQSSNLTITLVAATNTSILNEYLIEFTTAVAGTTVSFPSSIKWANGEKPKFDPDSTYQVSIVNNLGVCIKFA